MVDYYIAPGAGTGDGSGPADTAAAPDFTNVPWQEGLQVLVRRGTRAYLPPTGGWRGILLPAVNGITISHYGDALAPPILHGTVVHTGGWVNTGQGIYRRAGNVRSGVVLFNDEPLPFFNFDKSNARSLLAASDAGGYMISSGGSTPQIHVRLPGGSNPSQGGVAFTNTMVGIECLDGASDLRIDGIELMGFSRQGMHFKSVRNSIIENNRVHATGGDRAPSWYVGGGIQCTGGCDGIVLRFNHVYDVFDSPFSPQVLNSDSDKVLQNITYQNNLISTGWGLAGIEIASWTDDAIIRNIVVENNRIVDGGGGFSGMGDGPRGPCGVVVNTALSRAAQVQFQNIQIRGNHIANCPGGGVFFENANATGCMVESNTLDNCGHGGSRGRSGNGNVDARGAVELLADTDIDQDVTIASNQISQSGQHGIRFRGNGARSAGAITNNTIADISGPALQLSGTAMPSIRNNLCVGSGIVSNNGLPLDEDYNNVFAASQPFEGFTPGAHSTQVDPAFVDQAGGDYQLQSASPLIAAGQSPHRQDRLGRPYTSDDLGCYADKSFVPCVDLEALTANS